MFYCWQPSPYTWCSAASGSLVPLGGEGTCLTETQPGVLPWLGTLLLIITVYLQDYPWHCSGWPCFYRNKAQRPRKWERIGRIPRLGNVELRFKLRTAFSKGSFHIIQFLIQEKMIYSFIIPVLVHFDSYSSLLRLAGAAQFHLKPGKITIGENIHISFLFCSFLMGDGYMNLCVWLWVTNYSSTSEFFVQLK